jgi:flagellar motor protein MotB
MEATIMRALRPIGVLFLLLGIFSPVYAQQDKDKQQPPPKKEQQQPPKQQQQDKNKQQQQAQQQQQQRTQQAQQDRNRQHAQQQGSRPSQPAQRIQRNDERGVWQQHRAQNWQSEHRDWQQRGGYNGYRIPDDRYRVYFGQNHGFRIFSLGLYLFGGHPRFRYNGYWISLLDPWPEYWSDNWYENDDVYIDYDGFGYYMYNRRYPGDRIAVMVSIN